MSAAEPQMPICEMCGSTKGPWRPDPRGLRYLDGAQVLVCSPSCPEVEAARAGGANWLEAPLPEDGAL